LKPYYDHAGITIYNGDCRDILPTLGEDSVDLLVTDPPYGINFNSGWSHRSVAGDESEDVAREGIALSVRVLKYARHAYVFGRIGLVTQKLTPPVELIWDKENIGMGNLEIPWGSQHEYIQFYVSIKRTGKRLESGGLAARLRRGTVLRYPRINAASLVHPSEKPVALLCELVESSSRIGESVLDPFMGSGATLEAAKIERREAIGIEIEEPYCEIAAKRLSQEVLFPPETCGDLA